MKKLSIVLLVVLLASLVLVVPASAGPPILAAGTYDGAGPPAKEVVTDVGENCIIELTDLPYWFEGTLDGTALVDLRINFKGSCAESGPGLADETWNARGTFEGTVAGREGTFEFLYIAQSKSNGEFGIYNATFTITAGTGELEGLHGVLFVEDQMHYIGAPTAEYAGKIHFDP